MAFPISTATANDTTHTKKSPAFPPTPLKPESVAERIRNLADNRRVEDLRKELEHLPPGADRDLAIGLLAEHWFAFDHAGTIAWIASLKSDMEQELAYVPLIKAWTREDSEGASIWVAGLPKGSLKKQAARSLAYSLMTRDSAASLKWGIASRDNESDLIRDNDSDLTFLDSLAGSLGWDDPELAERILTESDLPTEQKRRLRNIAKKDWNRLQSLRGQWDKILPLETTSP